MIECSICKASNDDRSLYCMECGQRLMPKVPDPSATVNNLPAANAGFQQVNLTSSGRLHSPILDLGGHSGGKSGKGQFGIDEEMPHTANRQNNVSRNGLHSPLLDGRNQFVNPYPYSDEDDEKEEEINIPPNQAPNNNTEKSRLHSPVLDGPISASFSRTYIEESFAQEEEYESLRSPLLKAKVPLPEKNQATEKNAIHKKQMPESSTGQESRLQSVLGSATGSFAKLNPNTNNTAGTGQDNFVAPLSITGIDKLSKNVAPKSGGRESTKISNSHFLPPNEERISHKSSADSDKDKSGLNKAFLTSLIFLALAFKIWYLVSLGSAAFGSAPFAFDQGGQILILLLLVALVLN